MIADADANAPNTEYRLHNWNTKQSLAHETFYSNLNYNARWESFERRNEKQILILTFTWIKFTKGHRMWNDVDQHDTISSIVCQR